MVARFAPVGWPVGPVPSHAGDAAGYVAGEDEDGRESDGDNGDNDDGDCYVYNDDCDGYFGGDASDGCDADNGDHGDGIDGACASDEKC